MTKAFEIPKQQVVDAYRLVKTNAGSAGIDQQSLEDFERNLKDNLYKIWNHLSSGSYFPPPVMAVEIPKKSGGKRVLGIPTMKCRAMQALYLLALEPIAETLADKNSYGFRPKRSTADAIEQCLWSYAEKHRHSGS